MCDNCKGRENMEPVPDVKPALMSLLVKNQRQGKLWSEVNVQGAGSDPEVIVAGFRELYGHEITILAVLKALDERVTNMEKASLSFMLRVLPLVPGGPEELTEHFMRSGAEPEMMTRLAELLNEAEEKVASASAGPNPSDVG